MSRVKLLALLVLVVGGACMSLFAFTIWVNLTLSFFVAVSTRDLVLGYGSFIGVVPLIAGAILLLFEQTQKPGARVTLLGAAVLTLYLVICYFRLSFDSMEIPLQIFSMKIPLQILWFGVFPLAVIAVDWATYKVHRMVLPPVPPKTMAVHAG